MTNYSVFIKQGNEVCYNGRKVVIDEILDYTFEEIPTADELNKTPFLYFAGIIYDDMTTEIVPVCKLKSLRKVDDLTESELIELWRQIHVGSLSYKDYSNTMGVERKYLSDVCDSYLEAIDNNNSYEWLTKDTPMNFAEYCLDYCVLS